MQENTLVNQSVFLHFCVILGLGREKDALRLINDL